ncbi:transcriptional regulator, gntr family domain / aspartate aminotransferase [hydrocarbon metagenome]|uniref:Transcriptional regulator, gntr family domain / aspartate aminotransferase n=1 Tax=hydrocarbon metagenome TaxID=938273 RepID=A0A0W8E7N4_9ZZZZ
MEIFVSIQLHKQSSIPLYQQLAQQIKALILDGLLKDEEKLPPIRQLALRLGVNNVTVVNAYHRLEQEGLLYSKVGSGTFVKLDPHTRGPYSSTTTKTISGLEYNIPGLNIMDQGRLQIPSGAYNFASAIPTPELFPVADFKNILNEVLDRDGGSAFAYQEGQGYFPLRESLYRYLKNSGISADEGSIQVISGAQQGIDIIAKSLLKPGDFVITENPTYTGAIAAFRSRGARIIPAILKEDGISIEELQDAIEKYRPRLMYIIPNFQTPTGICYSDEKKKALLKLCQTYNIVIIEDDSFTDLSYHSQRQPIKIMDGDGQVIYIKSFSKILMPGLRLAFLLAPKNIIPGLLRAKHSSDISTPGLIQRAFDLYLRKGLWEKHLEYMKEIYQQRYHIMLEAMETYLSPEITYCKPGGGLSFWLKLPPGSSANHFYTRCLANRVIISPGSLFSASEERDSQYFRLSFAGLYPEEIEKGIIAINEAYQQKKNDLLYSPLL